MNAGNRRDPIPGPRPVADELRVCSVRDINYERLRRERLGHLQGQMARHAVGGLLLYEPQNIRYATGSSLFRLWSSENFGRYAVVPRTGRPVLFEWAGGMKHSQQFVEDVRPAYPLYVRVPAVEAEKLLTQWAAEIHNILHERGLADEPLGVDRLFASGFQALVRERLQLIDAAAVLEDAQIIKTADEIELMKINAGIADAAIADLHGAIRPGVREIELFAILNQAVMRMGGEVITTRLVASGTNTNPWYHEATDKVVRPGDLVAVDTDMSGIEGYTADISRTFLCGENPTAQQRDDYRLAYDFVRGVIELCRPGVAFAEIAERAPAWPEAYRANRYTTIIHGVGLGNQGPFVPFPDIAGLQNRSVPAGHVEENMVLCVEAYAGKAGGAQGVKLEEEILITSVGPQLLSLYPHEAQLLQSSWPRPPVIGSDTQSG